MLSSLKSQNKQRRKAPHKVSLNPSTTLPVLIYMSPSQVPNMSDSSSTTWFFTCTKIKFFSRIRRFLLLKTFKKQHKPSDKLEKLRVLSTNNYEEGMEKESDQDGWMVLQRSVKGLHFGSWEEKEFAAKEIKRLAKEDLKRRKSMAELGVIQPLVAMVESEVMERQRLAVQALIELANGSFTNKLLMVESGILSKLPTKIDLLDEPSREDFAQLLSSLSSLSNIQFPVSSAIMIPFVVSILESDSSLETKILFLGTLYNLSSVLENAGNLVTSGVVNTLLRLSSIAEASEKSLATLGNLAVTLTGRKALESNPMVPENLIEILAWEEKPKSQELSAYVLMILAHQSSVQRQKMAKAGIVPVLLEVALLGSSLAQKRALKLLQWFKDERQMRMGPHSGPQVGRLSIGSPVNKRDVDEGKKLMKNIVKQSLYKNMETITRRANGAGDSSRFKALVLSSSSKSLPY